MQVRKFFSRGKTLGNGYNGCCSLKSFTSLISDVGILTLVAGTVNRPRCWKQGIWEYFFCLGKTKSASSTGRTFMNEQFFKIAIKNSFVVAEHFQKLFAYKKIVFYPNRSILSSSFDSNVISWLNYTRAILNMKCIHKHAKVAPIYTLQNSSRAF